MDVSYERLWRLLVDRDMKRKDLAEKTNLSNCTVNKMNRGENANTDTLVEVCGVLNHRIEGITKIVPGEKQCCDAYGATTIVLLYCKIQEIGYGAN